LAIFIFASKAILLKKRNWREFLKQDSPVAAALMSRAGYGQAERVQIKLEFLRMMTRLELNPAKMQLIVGYFETYLRLGEEEEAVLEAQIHQLQAKEEAKIMELYTSWELKGMEKGMQQGIQQGIQKGKLEGEYLAKLELAHKLLAKGLVSIEEIIELTGLSREEIEQRN
jgi:predicted transposase/invertase (TIGR01784 family)